MATTTGSNGRARVLDVTPTVVRGDLRALTRRNIAGRVSRRVRETVEDPSQQGRASLGSQVLTPPWQRIRWTDIDSDRNLLEVLSADELMRFVMEVSPEGARALWDFLRYLNAGYEIKAFKPGTDKPHAQAQRELDEMRATIRRRHGSEDVVYNRLFMGALIGGAFFAELITDGTEFLDIATPDPRTVRFRRKTDAVYGQGWELGQLGKNSTFHSLDGVETVRYLPFDPWVGDPYGRSPFTPLMFPALTLLGVLRDARRVLQQAGFPQRHVTVDYDMVAAAMPRDEGMMDDDPPDPVALQEWIDDVIGEVADQIDNLPQDGTFITTSWITMDVADGALGENALEGLDAVVKVLERMLTRAAKSNPLLMGLVEGASEANANRQWETYAKSSSALQHPGEAVLGEMYGLGLQNKGIQADVKVRFAVIRSTDEYRQAQTMQLNVESWQTARDQGWASQDEASLQVVGHSAVGEAPAPTTIDTGSEPSGPNVTADGDEGPVRILRDLADRAYEHVNARMQRGVRFVPVGADAPLPTVPDPTPTTRGDERDAVAEWDAAMDDRDADGLLVAPVVDKEETV